MQVEWERKQDRLRAMVAVGALHALLGYAFLSGLGVEAVTRLNEDLKVFDVPIEPPPPAEEPIPAKARTKDPEGAAAPPGLKAKPSPVVAPPPKIRLEVPPPVVAAPLPSPTPGSARTAGASDIAGPGPGSGGEGTGTGSGGQGSGTGGGGAGGVGARRLSGVISGDRDYPAEARRNRIEGSVAVRFTVRPDGRVGGCEVLRSSGSQQLDETTCRLVERRFRYEPARDDMGRPIAETVRRTFDWMLPYRD